MSNVTDLIRGAITRQQQIPINAEMEDGLTLIEHYALKAAKAYLTVYNEAGWRRSTAAGVAAKYVKRLADFPELSDRMLSPMMIVASAAEPENAKIQEYILGQAAYHASWIAMDYLDTMPPSQKPARDNGRWFIDPSRCHGRDGCMYVALYHQGGPVSENGVPLPEWRHFETKRAALDFVNHLRRHGWLWASGTLTDHYDF